MREEKGKYAGIEWRGGGDFSERNEAITAHFWFHKRSVE